MQSTLQKPFTPIAPPAAHLPLPRFQTQKNLHPGPGTSWAIDASAIFFPSNQDSAAHPLQRRGREPSPSTSTARGIQNPDWGFRSRRRHGEFAGGGARGQLRVEVGGEGRPGRLPPRRRALPRPLRRRGRRPLRGALQLLPLLRLQHLTA
uniref:Uncharacterized protein n=1 Tax=Oryza brachyantha TaxID=4533 RepID=J3L440_ORYBR